MASYFLSTPFKMANPNNIVNPPALVAAMKSPFGPRVAKTYKNANCKAKTIPVKIIAGILLLNFSWMTINRIIRNATSKVVPWALSMVINQNLPNVIDLP
jgi:hypothetical protein